MKFSVASLVGAVRSVFKTLSSPSSRGGWLPVIRESNTGYWQRNIEARSDLATSYHAVFACITLIASDISKLGINLIHLEKGVWVETTNPAYSAVLRKPNPNQTRIQFVENWMLSKLMTGNTYVLKVRDARNVVSALKILDPNAVRPLISEDGQVFYQLSPDNFTGVVGLDITVPASEIIHDRFNCLFHPLVGISPLYACALAATQGMNIQNNSVRFFANGAQAPGILTTPGAISEVSAKTMKDAWEANYTGQDNYGKVAVLGDGVKFERMAMSSVDSQLIQQLEWTAEVVCSVFHVPGWKVGVGTMPVNSNIQSSNIQYLSQCLQSLIESLELCLDEGLSLPLDTGVAVDVDGLLRMDSSTQATTISTLSGAGLVTINEGRKRLGLPPIKGGDTAYLQQQNFSLAALQKRDAKDDPFATAQKASTTPAIAAPAAGEDPAKMLTIEAVAVDVDEEARQQFEILTIKLKNIQKELEIEF